MPQPTRSRSVLTLAIAGGTVLTAGALIWGIAHLNSDANPSVLSTQHDPTPTTRCGFAVGDTAAYAITASRETRFNPAAALAKLQGGLQGATLHATASHGSATTTYRLDAQALAVTDRGHTILGVQLRDIDIDVHASSRPDVAPAKNLGHIDRPFLVRLGDRCEVLEFAWERSADRVGAYTQQRFFANLNTQLPDDANAAYTFQGFDAYGRFKARYTPTAPDALQGHIKAYTHAHTNGALGGAPLASVETSSIHVGLDDAPWFGALNTHQTRSVRFEGDEIGRDALTLRADRDDFHSLDADLDPSNPSWVWGSLLASPPSVNVAHSDGSVFGDLKTMTLAQALEHLGTFTPNGKPGMRAYLEFLTNWLRLHPDAIAELLKLMRSPDHPLNDNVLASDLLMLALVNTNTQAARDALMTFGGPGYPRALQYQALRALRKVSPLPEGYLDTVLAHINNPESPFHTNNSLKLIVGAAAKSQRTSDPQAAAELSAQIQTWLNEAAESDDINTVRGALATAGNAGDPSMLETLDAFAQSDDPEIRSAAARAMRNMPTDAAFEALSDHAHDPATGVRVNALKTLNAITTAHHTPPPEALIAQLADNLSNVTHNGELHQTLEALSTAGKHGDAAATAAIQRELDAAMTDPAGNHDRIKTLGLYQPRSWSAHN